MILSALSPAELVNVISTENANMLKTVKGIGLKTAQRVIVDLKDKIKTGAVAAATGGATGTLLPAMNAEVQEEAVAALTMLGFAAAPSQKVVLAILKEEPDAPVEKVIKLALKTLRADGRGIAVADCIIELQRRGRKCDCLCNLR